MANIYFANCLRARPSIYHQNLESFIIILLAFTHTIAMHNQISIVIISKNSDSTIQKTLESTLGFDEVVVYDNGSDDGTLAIVRKFENVSLHQGSFIGFGPTKNLAVSLARHDWIVSLDSDETITRELTEYLRQWKPDNNFVVGFVRRKNFFMGQYVKRGGWGNDWLLRVFNRTTHQFNDAPVHEKVDLSKQSIKQKLPYPIEHNAIQEISQLLIKLERYSEIRRTQGGKTFHPWFIVLRSLFAFFRSYIIRAGIVDGWRGLVIAWNEADHVFYKYMKRYVDKVTRTEKNQ